MDNQVMSVREVTREELTVRCLLAEGETKFSRMANVVRALVKECQEAGDTLLVCSQVRTPCVVKPEMAHQPTVRVWLKKCD